MSNTEFLFFTGVTLLFAYLSIFIACARMYASTRFAVAFFPMLYFLLEAINQTGVVTLAYFTAKNHGYIPLNPLIYFSFPMRIVLSVALIWFFWKSPIDKKIFERKN